MAKKFDNKVSFEKFGLQYFALATFTVGIGLIEKGDYLMGGLLLVLAGVSVGWREFSTKRK